MEACMSCNFRGHNLRQCNTFYFEYAKTQSLPGSRSALPSLHASGKCAHSPSRHVGAAAEPGPAPQSAAAVKHLKIRRPVAYDHTCRTDLLIDMSMKVCACSCGSWDNTSTAQQQQQSDAAAGLSCAFGAHNPCWSVLFVQDKQMLTW